jgi:hypothetical protein
MSGDVMRTQGSRWRSATVHSVFLVLVVTLLVLGGFALLRRPDREVPAEQGGLGWLTSNLLHDSGCTTPASCCSGWPCSSWSPASCWG